MHIPLLPRSQKVQRDIIIGAAVTAVLLGAAVLWGQPIIDALSNKEQAKDLIESAGIFGPLVFILIQIAQVVVAPLPGQVSGLVGGYLFGVTLGTAYSLIGASIGFLIIFALARKLGRPFVERFFSKELISKFDYITESKGTLALFLIFLLPAFPDDLICYLAGLSKIPIWKLLLISIAGRLPGYLVLSMTGSGLSYENMNPIIITLAAALLIFGLAFWQRAWLQGLTRSKDYVLYVKNNWHLSKLATSIWLIGLTALSIFMYWAATVTPIQQ